MEEYLPAGGRSRMTASVARAARPSTNLRGSNHVEMQLRSLVPIFGR